MKASGESQEGQRAYGNGENDRTHRCRVKVRSRQDLNMRKKESNCI